MSRNISKNVNYIPSYNSAKILTRERNWIAGGITGIKWEQRNKGGQWDPYLPTAEIQVGKYFDTHNCTTFGTLNPIETQEIMLLGIERNYSDMFVGALAGLKEWGNFATNPPDAIREYGLVLEDDFPWDRNDPNFTFEDYIKLPVGEILLKGKEWHKTRKLQYEIITDNSAESLMHQLEHAPLSIVTKVCPGWNDGDKTPVPACGSGTGHEYMLYGYEYKKYWKVFDHYKPFVKKLAWDYNIPFILKNLLTIVNETSMSNEAINLIANKQGKYVLAKPSGRIALVKGQELQEVPALPLYATDADKAAYRASLMALMGLVIKDNGSISDSVYDEIPHRPF